MSEEVVSRAEFETLLHELQDVKKRLQEFEKKLSVSNEISEETAQIIAAAVAAYLGERAQIRIIRRVSDADQWRQQGRTALQASHSMPRTRALHN
jgi:predicted  nucleic acid-binding Zn-ribbon protein